MKTLFILFSLFFASASSPIISNEVPQNEVIENQENSELSDDEAIKISIKFEMGRKKKNCRGFGICSITVEFELSLFNENAGGGYGSNVDGALQVELMKSTMTPETMETYFANNVFVVEEDFEIPEELIDALRLDKTVVEVGEYQVQDMGDFLAIQF